MERWLPGLLLVVVATLLIVSRKYPGLPVMPGTKKQKGGVTKKTAAQTQRSGKTNAAGRVVLHGYLPGNQLPDGAERLVDEIMPYKEFLLRFAEFKPDPKVGLDEPVLVVRTALSRKCTHDNKERILTTVVYRAGSGALLLEAARKETNKL